MSSDSWVTLGAMAAWRNGAPKPHHLIVLNFDHTLVCGNVTATMRTALACSRCHCDSLRTRALVRRLPEVRGMCDFVRSLQHYYCDFIIISNSNLLFVTEWLCARKLQRYFLAIYTNPIRMLPNGQVLVESYHYQVDCPSCDMNLCKGMVLQQFLQRRRYIDNIAYKFVVYVGDDVHDLCASLSLQEHDFVCARRDFELAELLTRKPQRDLLKAELLFWKDGRDLVKMVRDKLSQSLSEWMQQKQKLPRPPSNRFGTGARRYVPLRNRHIMPKKPAVKAQKSAKEVDDKVKETVTEVEASKKSA